MRHDYLYVGQLVAASAAVGWIGWSGHVLLLPAATLFPAIWSLAKTRRQATCVSAAYFLSASRGLPQGVANFYSADVWPGLLLWGFASSSFVIVHSMLWSGAAGWRKPTCYLVACFAMAVPPFGILGWAHPLTAAGVLFGGWSWIGIAAMMACLALMTTRLRSVAAFTVGGFWLWSAAFWTGPNGPASWEGVDLQLGASLGRDPSLERQAQLATFARQNHRGTTIVFPESAIGFWTRTVDRWWQKALAGSGVTVIAGAVIIYPHGYENVLVRMSSDGSDIFYRQRMPVPGSMWQPWRRWLGQDGGTKADFFANPVVDFGGLRSAPLICYEQLIIWPVLHSLLYDPDVIVAVGNGWWASDTSIVEIQRASAQAWARLFDKRLVLSFNTSPDLIHG